MTDLLDPARAPPSRPTTLCLQVPYEQLRLLLEERSAELEVLCNRLLQREASLEVMRRNFEQQVGGCWGDPVYNGCAPLCVSCLCMLLHGTGGVVGNVIADW